MNLLENKSFESFFTPGAFERYYATRLKGKRSAGRDRISADAFFRREKDKLDELARKCVEGKYEFSVYNERLIVKGRGKIPRVISIPTMRDRLVLGVLNRYLQDKLGDCVERRPVNQLINRIKKYRHDNPHSQIRFFKTDYSGFYDSLDRNRVVRLLEERGVDPRAVDLVRRAIETPTSGGTKMEASVSLPEEYGIPQGLSISNLLSSLYVKELDKLLENSSSLFIRYVDDIVILNPKEGEIADLIRRFADGSNMNLTLNPDKTKEGVVGENELEFLGYSFTEKALTVKRSNVTNFLNRIAKECLNFRRLYRNKVLRPTYLEDDDTFVETRLFLLDFSLKGIRVNGKYFGWLHHFQEIDDIGLLSMIDRRIRNQMLAFLPKKYKDKVSSLRKLYFRLMDGEANRVVYDYDALQDVGAKRAYLIRRGILDPLKNYTDEELELLYLRDREMIMKRNEANIGQKY